MMNKVIQYSAILSRQASLRSNRKVLALTQSRWSSSSTPVSPKLQGIIDSIKELSLLETADLVKALKQQLNIKEVAMPVAAAPAAPAAPAADSAKSEEPAKPVEKTEFKIKLEKIDANQKAKMIREIKNVISGMNLVEAKKFVESVPKVVKEAASKEDAAKIKAALEAVGGVVLLE